MDLKVEFQICDICKFYKYHNEEIMCPSNHFSCLCQLYTKKFICCKNGYSNLIKNIPLIGLYTPFPEIINDYYVQNSMCTIFENKTILEVLKFAMEEKLEILNSQNYSSPYFNSYSSKWK